MHRGVVHAGGLRTCRQFDLLESDLNVFLIVGIPVGALSGAVVFLGLVAWIVRTFKN